MKPTYSFLRLVNSVLPALFILSLTIIISLITGHPKGLFLSRSVWGILVRFILVTIIFISPVLTIPRLLMLTVKLAKNEWFPWQLVIGLSGRMQELSKTDAWVIRPLQGIGLSMIFAERLINLLEFLPARLVLFFLGSALVSLFLSVIWALDDSGIKIYNSKTGEVYLAGRSIGTLLPLIGGAIGISGLFHLNSPLDALIDLFEIVMVLYPSYVFFVIFHREFMKRRISTLSEKFTLKRMEMNLR